MQRRMRFCFFFNDTATSEIYTLALHDALPISLAEDTGDALGRQEPQRRGDIEAAIAGGRAKHLGAEREERAFRFLRDRKSTRLNSSHANISYAAFCLQKTKYLSSCPFFFCPSS